MNSLIDEEPIIFYYSTMTNFGVSSKNIKSPKNIHMSYSPLSTNQHISFSNTIMIPSITTEDSIETEKNICRKASLFQSEKSRLSQRKDYTRFKTESSKEEKNNISGEKQTTRIIIDNDIDKIDESSDELDLSNKKNLEYIKKNNILEINPYFLGGKFNNDIKNQIQDNNNEIEKNKVKKILNKNKTITINEAQNNCHTSKNLRKKTMEEIHPNKTKINNKIKRMQSLNSIKGKKSLHLDKKKNENKVRQNTIKNKTSIYKGNNVLHNSVDKEENNDKKTFKRNNKMRASKRGRIKTVIYKSPIIKIKDNNIKVNKANFFNINISSKLISNENYNNIIKDKKEEKEKEKEKILKEKKKKIKYNGLSDNTLKFRLNLELLKKHSERKEKRESKIKDIHPKEKENNHDYKIRATKTNSINIQSSIKKMNTLNREINTAEKKKMQKTSKKKMSEATKNVDFESALKNKNNLAKTQFNLFSPDKFTNTEFCDSDYCEYTLECMNLILDRDTAQKQQKSKVNFNFPKSKGNRQKKIALFDLDETLVHCTGDINLKAEPYQHCINVVLPGNIETKVGINIRPFWKKTMNLIRKYYHIVVFTASHQAYADAVLDFMDPTKKYFKYRLYRNNCSLVDINDTKFYVKDLDIFDEYYDLKDIIIIDNSVLSFIYHLENGIPIVPYYNEDKDGSLYVVGLYLIHIHKESDLREANKKYINLNSFLNEAKEKKLKESPINEESFNSSVITESIEKRDDIHKTTLKTITESKKQKSNDNIKNLRRSSFSVGKTQLKLMSRSKLINVYYEINKQPISEKKMVAIIEERSNKSYSVDEEEFKENENEKEKDNEDEKENEENNNLNQFFFNHRLFSTDDKPFYTGKSQSNKVLNNYSDLKVIRSNFFNKFSVK